MLANELMLGDLVCDSREKKPRKVQRIEKECIDIHGNVLTHIRHIQPIPLTNEILFNNGFIEYKEDDGIHTTAMVYDGFGIMYIRYNRFKQYWYIETQDTYIRIKYVHEFQNLLRLCGLRNMADNFKI